MFQVSEDFPPLFSIHERATDFMHKYLSFTWKLGIISQFIPEQKKSAQNRPTQYELI